MRTPIGTETVGKYFVDERGELWKHIAYSDRPTATLERVSEPQFVAMGDAESRMTAVVGSQLLDGFTLLIPEGDV